MNINKTNQREFDLSCKSLNVESYEDRNNFRDMDGCWGTFGTYGTATMCLGTAGTLGSCG